MNVEPLRVKDFMTTDPLTVTADMPIMEAVKLFVAHDISGVVVVNADFTPVGILTERDCIRNALLEGYLDEATDLVADRMSRDIRSVSPEDSIMDVAELFAESPFRRCPVVQNGRLVGIIFRRDVLRALTAGAWFSEPV